MGDINQRYFLERNIKPFKGKILEIGSKDYGSTENFRTYFKDAEYIGVDMEEGKGVDYILDLAKNTGDLEWHSFDLIICCSVLEHVDKPWIFAMNVTKLLKKDGLLFISVPWVWRYHPYPDDYYRFSWRGIVQLFDNFDWAKKEYSTNIPNEFFDIEVNNVIDNQMAIHKRKDFFSFQKRKYLPYLMTNMIGKYIGDVNAG